MLVIKQLLTFLCQQLKFFAMLTLLVLVAAFGLEPSTCSAIVRIISKLKGTSYTDLHSYIYIYMRERERERERESSCILGVWFRLPPPPPGKKMRK
jgi:hypothetical protein